jgi:threonylcarbamoyladenosine tRNA methylthiotransferase MtaB
VAGSASGGDRQHLRGDGGSGAPGTPGDPPRAHANHPARQIIVTGCAAQTEPAMFAADAGSRPRASATHDKSSGRELWAPVAFAAGSNDKVQVNDIMSVRSTAGHLIEGMDGRTRAFVQVQNGCDHRCTFCIIPYGRGNSRSVPMGVVVEQIKRLVGTRLSRGGADRRRPNTVMGCRPAGPADAGQSGAAILRLVPDLPRLRISSIDSIEADEALNLMRP